MIDPMQINPDAEHPVADRFLADLAEQTDSMVIEFGTKRWDPNLITHHMTWAPKSKGYWRVDVEDGLDVDVVADLHDLRVIPSIFTAAIAVATWEHLRHPWIATEQLNSILVPGALVYVQTHMAFPEHGVYGGDFTRWTRDGLAALFESAGFETIETSYTLPCKLTPPFGMTRWNWEAPAWLCVDWYGRKP